MSRLTAGHVDPTEWDRFLQSVPGSHHLQTSLWAELKRPSGWKSIRLALRQDAVVVGGLQILYREIYGLGRVGYCPRGPVLANDDDRLPALLMHELGELIRSERFRYLAVQPPAIGAAFVAPLVASGFRATPFQVAPTATVLVDLAQPPEALLGDMRASTRRAVRIGLSSPLVFREGALCDLPAFHALLVSTGVRRGFSPPPLDYFQRMWALFSPTEAVRLFIVELEGEAVAAELDVALGDTIVSKRAGWSGRHGKLHPNELLIWSAMKWARERGFKHYDMDGLDPELAECLATGLPVPGAMKESHHWFKLGFTSKATILPNNFELVRVPMLGWAHREVWCQWLDMTRRRSLLKKVGAI
jgi:peptidoglycan pentaglycine glycine transferase (the first glycine)